jgi:hypothetical protein
VINQKLSTLMPSFRSISPVQLFCTVWLFCLSASAASAAVAVDIRANHIITTPMNGVSYTAAIDNCQNIARVDFSVGGQTQTFDASDKLFNENALNGCLYTLDVLGDNLLNPSVTLLFSDNSEQVYSENFVVEQTPPQIEFNSVAIQSTDGQQFLISTVDASDNADIAYLEYSIVGIRASDLRSVGGVIELARPLAYAATQGAKRVYPQSDNQTRFSLHTPVIKALSAQAIARDAIVMLTVDVVDASGNQSAFSKIAFTGDSIQENVLALSVSPSKLIFSNALETAAIIPTVDFEFRGPTALAGAGSGVSYFSSHPDLVNVGADGVVYPLAETGDTIVTIEVSYAGLTSVSVPVEVNYSKNIIGLKPQGFEVGDTFTINSLNQPQLLPPMLALFDDNTEAEVGTQLTY